MNKEILNQIKQEYQEMAKISKGDFSEITELEKNPIVQRYKHLMRIKETCYGRDSDYEESYIFNEIINKFGNGIIKETNKIWFYFLNMPLSKYEEIFNKSLGGMNRDSIVSVYLNLENAKEVIAIPLEKKTDFESKNIVVRGKQSIDDPSDRYYNKRYNFFKLCITEGQDLAIKRMLEKESSTEKDKEVSKSKICKIK